MGAVIHARDVRKRYGRSTLALDGLDFDVAAGRIVGLMGPNGAGKTTTMRMISGFTAPTTGKVVVAGHDMSHDNFDGAKKIGYLPEQPPLYDVLKVKRYLQFVSKVKGIHRSRVNSELDRVMNACRLETVTDKEIYKLSKGYRQRVGLAQALLGDPEVLLLDEPFSHIDNFKKQSLRKNFFSFLSSNKITCVIATHDKEDALPFSNKVIVLHQGEIIANETPHGLYNNPKSPLIASFFEEYSLFKNSELEINKTNKNTIVYSNQLKKTKSSQIKAVVTDSYFKGSYYLIEATFNNKMIFFNHTEALKNKSVVFLEYINTMKSLMQDWKKYIEGFADKSFKLKLADFK